MNHVYTHATNPQNSFEVLLQQALMASGLAFETVIEGARVSINPTEALNQLCPTDGSGNTSNSQPLSNCFCAKFWRFKIQS